MTKKELDRFLHEESEAYPAKVSFLMADLASGRVLHTRDQNAVFPSASTIKVAILCAVFEELEAGALALDDAVPVPSGDILEDTEYFEPQNPAERHTLLELLSCMICESDNTATNAVISLVGMEKVNALCARWGAKDTRLRRKMLDFDAAARGEDNVTTACDQYALYAGLYRRSCENPGVWYPALDILLHQRCQDALLRYITAPVSVAHKTGGLDHVTHDAGLFLSAENPYFLGIFTWDGPALDGEPEQKKFIGRLSRAVYDNIQEVDPA